MNGPAISLCACSQIWRTTHSLIWASIKFSFLDYTYTTNGSRPTEKKTSSLRMEGLIECHFFRVRPTSFDRDMDLWQKTWRWRLTRAHNKKPGWDKAGERREPATRTEWHGCRAAHRIVTTLRGIQMRDSQVAKHSYRWRFWEQSRFIVDIAA